MQNMIKDIEINWN